MYKLCTIIWVQSPIWWTARYLFCLNVCTTVCHKIVENIFKMAPVQNFPYCYVLMPRLVAGEEHVCKVCIWEFEMALVVEFHESRREWMLLLQVYIMNFWLLRGVSAILAHVHLYNNKHKLRTYFNQTEDNVFFHASTRRSNKQFIKTLMFTNAQKENNQKPWNIGYPNFHCLVAGQCKFGSKSSFCLQFISVLRIK